MSDIVISGIAGRFPQSDNVENFKENLLNKVYLVGDPENRIKFKFSGVASSYGLMRNLEKFDYDAFRFPKPLVKVMDPQGRISIEHVYEALVDAGVSPKSLSGSKTGVFVGCFNYDSLEHWMYNEDLRLGLASIGNTAYALSNRISYVFGLQGPSMAVDTACSSSMYALDFAYKSIKNGSVDAAVVVGSNLILNPFVTKDFSRAQALALNGISQPFDKKASGFVRSEAICVLFLQKSSDARRVYATILNSATNNDGNKIVGITHPSAEIQANLLNICYEKLNISPNDVDYFEAHATSTETGDIVELHSIDDFFCGQRTSPLKVGSVKGNTGHTEGASGTVSILKSILVFENGKLFPNINIDELRDDCPGLTEGRLQVVREVEQFDGKIIGINNFGVMGTNAHCVLKRNEKVKENGGFPYDNLPRLLLWSGRTEEGVNLIFDDILSRPFDDEYLSLLQYSQSESMNGMNVKGFSIYKIHQETRSVSCFDRRVKILEKTNPPVVFVYAGMGSQWLEMGRDLMKIPLIAESIQKCHDVLAKHGFDLKNILTSNSSNNFDHCVNIFVGIASIQIALTDLVCSIGIKPDYYIGHSFGELGCSYIDKTLSLEETILTAYCRGLAAIEGVKTSGKMAAVAMKYEELEKILPNDIEIACHNSIESCTISGPVESVEKFVKEIKSEHVLAKIVETCGIGFHSSMIADCGPILAEKLKDVIKNPKIRSSKWITTSEVDENDGYSSIQYHVNNMIGKVHFAEGMAKIPENAVMIEIAPHGLLQPILKQSVPNGITESLTKRDTQDGVIYLLQALGRIYQSGVDMNIREIYPKINFPVSRSTPMISPLIKWKHEIDFPVPMYNPFTRCDKRKLTINLKSSLFSFLKGHQIDDRAIIPGAGYLLLAVESIAMMNGVEIEEIAVCIEDIKFTKATQLNETSETSLTVIVDRAINTFDLIDDSNESICRGKIRVTDENDFTIKKIGIIPSNANENLLMKDDFYKELRIRGYQYKDEFKIIEKIQNFTNSSKRYGEIEWKGNFLCFVDAMAQVVFTNCDNRELMLPIFLRRAVFNQKEHRRMIEDLENCRKVVDENGNERIFFDLLIDENMKIYRSGGVEITGLEFQVVSRKKAIDPVLETYEFIPYSPTPNFTAINAAKFSIQILLENAENVRHNVVEILEDEMKENTENALLIESMMGAFKETLLSTANFHLFTNSKIDNISDVKVSELNEFEHFESFDFLIVKKWKNEYGEKLNENGIVLLKSGEDTLWKSNKDLKKVANIQMETENLLLLKKMRSSNFTGEIFEVPITQESFEWIEDLRKLLEKSDDIILHSRSEMSGILGFFKTLRKENYEKKLKCFIIEDKNAPKFDPKIPIYAEQLDLGLTINILKNGKWGNFHHLSFNQEVESQPQTNHTFVHLLNRGSLSSISWVNGDLNVDDENNIDVHYSALNFRDIMVASSRISMDHLFANRKAAQYKIGLEFSGITKDGKRVAGLCESKGMSNSVKKVMFSDRLMCLEVPDKISLEDAATIPVVYLTVYIAYFIKSQIKSGQTILIHSGSGGLGQAAIQTALAYGMKVFTTCGSNDKREFLLKQFPELKNEEIGNSRDTSFEQMIIEQTNGHGVDYVMNSLVEDKMHASLRCLAKNGTFFEVGKFDILMGKKITLQHFTKDIKYFGITLSMQYLSENEDDVSRIFRQIESDLENEKIKPLNRTVFEANDVEKAFRYMTTGNHIGKILLKIRESENMKMSLPIQVKPQVFFDAEKSYVLVGGLGGMGMEIADWMVMRNCMKLVFSSSRGISNSYQSYRIGIWKSYGVKVVVSTSDVTTKAGCTKLLETANKLGSVGGIFNLAAILHDVKFEEQTTETFEKSFKPKALSTIHLDEVSRSLCPNLDHFVFFSSASGGRGFASQTNYGLSNSVGDKIILNRHEVGLCGKAIQFGPIRDVGLLSYIEKNEVTSFFGYSLQSISSCLDVLDKILLRNEPIFSSIVFASKVNANIGYDNFHATLLEVLGVTDESSIDQNQTLAELGVDSISGHEIQQMCQREAGISMTLKEIRSKTYKEMKEFAKKAALRR